MPALSALCLVTGYCIGSIPAGYLLIRWKRDTDLRASGSGNVGAMNAYEVTGSRSLGLTVMAIDVIKGLVAAIAARWISADQFVPVIAGTLGAVLGHNFPVWLRFNGGRGLATAAGAMLPVCWIMVPVWVLLWIVFRVVSRDLHVANMIACLLTPGAFAVIPGAWLEQYQPIHAAIANWIVAALVLNALLLTGHAGPLKQLWTSLTNSKRTGS